MAHYTIRNNAEINLLTQPELDQTLDRFTRDWYQEAARGYSTAPIESQATITTGKVTFPPPGPGYIGPDTGLAWRVNRLTIQGLATNDVISVFENDTNHLVDVITAAKPAIYPGKGLIIRGGQRLLFTGTGLTATGDLLLTGAATEVPELDLYKLH